MLNSQTKTIDGVEYSCQELPPKKALLLKYRLLKFVGKSFRKLVTTLDIDKLKGSEETKLAKENLTEAAQILGDFFEKLEPEQAVTLLEEIVTQAKIDGRNLNLDMDFQGNWDTAYKVAFFVLSVNFSKYFKKLGEFQNLGKLLG